MKREYAPLRANCPVCQDDLCLSIEILEYMEDVMETQDPSFEDEIDKIMRNEDGQKHLTKFEPVPFPVSLDLIGQGLVFLGWCKSCLKPRMFIITPKELEFLLKEANDEADEEENDE